MARAENRAVFHGWAAAGFKGIAESCSHDPLTLSGDFNAYTGQVAEAVETLLRAGIKGPYALRGGELQLPRGDAGGGLRPDAARLAPGRCSGHGVGSRTTGDVAGRSHSHRPAAIAQPNHTSESTMSAGHAPTRPAAARVRNQATATDRRIRMATMSVPRSSWVHRTQRWVYPDYSEANVLTPECRRSRRRSPPAG